MVVTKEYVIPLPMSVDEYNIGQLWIDAEARKKETNIEMITDEPCVFEDIEGRHTYKLTKNDSRVPSFVRYLAPSGSLDVYEEVWNSYPKCKATITNGLLKDRFHISMKIFYVPDDAGTTKNFYKLPNYDEIERVIIDIANDSVSNNKAETDPSRFVSEKTGRGKLGKNWIENLQSGEQTKYPYMCCYVQAEVQLKIPTLQAKIENMIQSSVRGILTNRNRELFCAIDKWYDLKPDEIGATML